MTKREELQRTVNEADIEELGRLLDSILYVDVTYGEDILEMAKQAIRLIKIRATEARNILYGWEGVNGQRRDKD